MADETPEPLKDFEGWLLRRVAQAIEAGEVPADLLTKLQAEFEAARERPQEEAHAKALKDVAERLMIPHKHVEAILTALEAQPATTRELLMRRIAGAWLEGHRVAYRAR